MTFTFEPLTSELKFRTLVTVTLRNLNVFTNFGFFNAFLLSS